jgi:glycine cleavage system T protein
MTDAKKTVLFEKHAALAAKAQIVPFAGWMMPLWYKSISQEHQAVRKTAGLFDCTHMAFLKITGKDASKFLNLLITNEVTKLKPGKAQYAYILDYAGDIIDDVIVYCIADDNFMLVANASNEQKVKDWLAKTKQGQIEIADLKDPSLPDARVDMALQGPAAAECLKKIFGIDVGSMKSLSFVFAKAKDIDVIITSTGYTGAKVSYELFVHPNKAAQLWDMILEAGKPLGIIPCGLGSRDSLRIEAGLPLYGHELAGDFNISPFQAGYGWAVKMQKENFIGKNALAKKLNYDTEVARLKFDGGKGVRPIRQLDGVLNADGVCIGYVLSCAAANEAQIALALIEKEYNLTGKPVGIYYTARNAGHIQQGRKEKVNPGDKLAADIKGTTVERFEKF